MSLSFPRGRRFAARARAPITSGAAPASTSSRSRTSIANAIDQNPAVLLEWRGCTTEEPAWRRSPASVRDRPLMRGPPGSLPAIGAPRPLPVGSVLKRLGASGLVVDGVDLRDALEPAYAAFAGRTRVDDVRTQTARGAEAPLADLRVARAYARASAAGVVPDDELSAGGASPGGGPKPIPPPPGPPWPP